MHWRGDGCVVGDGYAFGSSRVRGSVQAARIITRVWHEAKGRQQLCETSKEVSLLSWWNAQHRSGSLPVIISHLFFGRGRASGSGFKTTTAEHPHLAPPETSASAALVR
jgi:hypothetical protein